MLKRYIFILLSCALLSSCNFIGGKKTQSKQQNVTVERYDRLQYEYFAMNSVSAMQKMNTDYPNATKLLIEDVLELGKVDDNHINERLVNYFRDTTLIRIMSDAEDKYRDISDIEKKMTKGFLRLKREVPSIRIPRVYSQFSALNQSVIVDDSIIGISLDKYMGADYPLYKKFYFDYQSRTMNKDRIVPDCFTFYLLSEYPLKNKNHSTLIDAIMHTGKINWVVANVLGYDSFEKELGYNKEEKEWCEDNEDTVLKDFFKKENLYTRDSETINNYLLKEPISKLFSYKTPPSIGIWMGMVLVDRYMKENKSTSINDLLNDDNYAKMLSQMNIKI